jgi:biopolymer transport protein ExbD
MNAPLATRRLQNRPLLDLVPLIDIVFQLVLFFLVSTSLVQREVFPLRLPAAESAETGRTAALAIELDAGGTISMNGLPVGPEALDAALAQAAADQGGGTADSPLSLLLRADERVPYGEVARVMDAARLAGFTAIELVVIGK